MNFFRFQNPWWLLLIIPILLAWLALLRSKRANVLVFSTNRGFHLPQTWATILRPIVLSLIPVGLLLAAVAMARPQQGREAFRVRTDGIAIVMCLDRSGSMQAMDFFIDNKRVDRLEVVKNVFRDFVLGNHEFSGRPDDRVALIAFGGYVDSICPLTLDHQVLADMLEMVQCPKPLFDRNGRMIRPQIIEEEAATAIGDALVMSADRLKNCDAKSKVIILLSDGVQNTGIASPEEAAAIARDNGIRVYTIGIGTGELVPFPVYGANGEKSYARQIVELDTKALKEIAQTTGGQYYHVHQTDALRNVCNEIDKLEKSSHEDRIFTKYHELYRRFLWPAVVILMIGVILVQTRFKTIP